MLTPARRLTRLMNDREINHAENDVLYATWAKNNSGKQVGLNDREAFRLCASMKTATPAEQRSIVAELHRRHDTQPDSGEHVRMTAGAARLLNAFAGELGLDLVFTRGRKVPVTPPWKRGP